MLQISNFNITYIHLCVTYIYIYRYIYIYSKIDKYNHPSLICFNVL